MTRAAAEHEQVGDRGYRLARVSGVAARRDESCWVEVDLDAIRGNVAIARRVSGTAVMAVVKADGYGHGAVPVARAALDGGASWLGVARAGEALQLRAAGIETPLLMLGYTPPGAMTELVAADVSLTIWTTAHLEQASAAAATARRPASVHLKIDTGMTRVGVRPEDARALATQLVTSEDVVLQGIFTHFACADEPDPSAGVTAGQQQRFAATLTSVAPVFAELDAAGRPRPLVHAANSAATFAVPEAAHDLVRFGIAMYGLSPGEAVRLPDGVRPALRWSTVLARVEQVPPGEGVSYGHRYHTTARQRIGTIPVGYADGWRRVDGNEVLVGGRRVPVLGRVCMDQCMIDLDGVPEAEIGDEVVLIGSQDGAGGTDRITADDVAARWGTIGYEVVCGIGRRVPRFSDHA
ncbi:MAG: alanine racemase [Kineosporiaceae bacterium]|nr:alanine racemase [Kineosporiaceae bacterium]